MIKNLMFDLGGVIMDIRRQNAVDALVGIGMRNAGELLGEYGQKGVFLDLEKGLVSPGDFRKEIRKEISCPVSDDEIDNAFIKFLVGIPVQRLRQLEGLRRDYKIFMLSNTNKIMWDGMIVNEFRKDGHDIGYYFDGVITSFEAHAYKPDSEIFLKAVEKFSIKPEETLFFDDSKANVSAAADLGFKGVHVCGGIDFKDYID